MTGVKRLVILCAGIAGFPSFLSRAWCSTCTIRTQKSYANKHEYDDKPRLLQWLQAWTKEIGCQTTCMHATDCALRTSLERRSLCFFLHLCVSTQGEILSSWNKILAIKWRHKEMLSLAWAIHVSFAAMGQRQVRKAKTSRLLPKFLEKRKPIYRLNRSGIWLKRHELVYGWMFSALYRTTTPSFQDHHALPNEESIF